MAKNKHEISFKNTSRDMKLYALVGSQEEKSEYVKNAIEFYDRYEKYASEIEILAKNLEKENK